MPTEFEVCNFVPVSSVHTLAQINEFWNGTVVFHMRKTESLTNINKHSLQSIQRKFTCEKEISEHQITNQQEAILRSYLFNIVAVV